ncbi:MAG: hypothetical protein LIO77_09295 [Rikenellaceae bacterium]|nr:hypothetical protein [Rikenellaceae bacterium]
MACELTIEGSSYLVEEFDMDCDMRDNKGYIPFYAVFSDKLPAPVQVWVGRSNDHKDVTVKLFRNVDTLSEGALMAFNLYGVGCTAYRQAIRDDVSRYTLVMAATGIKVFDQEYS